MGYFISLSSDFWTDYSAQRWACLVHIFLYHRQ